MKFRILLYAALAIAFCMAGCRERHHYDVSRELYPVKGIDISAHNGKIDFAQVKADTVSFVYIKASEGTDFSDPLFTRNYTEAKAAGLNVGAYHFFRFDRPGHLQAYHFITLLLDKELDLPVAIDVEEWQNAEEVPEDEVAEQLEGMVNVLEGSGYNVLIYTNRNDYQRYVKGRLDKPIWLSSLRKVEDSIPWTLWQHSHEGQVKGIEGPVDLNTFNGGNGEFDSWRNGSPKSDAQ